MSKVTGKNLITILLILILFFSFQFLNDEKVTHTDGTSNTIQQFRQKKSKYKLVDCINKKIMPCVKNSDCAVFCTQKNLECVGNRCTIPTESLAKLKCNREKGGMYVLKGIDSLGISTWECECMVPHLFDGAGCEDKKTYVCAGGVFPNLHSTCKCPAGKKLMYANNLNAFSTPIPLCVSMYF